MTKRLLSILLAITMIACTKNETETSIDNGSDSQPEIVYTDVDIPNSTVKIRMVLVKAGSFMMGASTEQVQFAQSNEKPVHKVILTEDYYIAETPITQAQFKAVMGYDNSEFPYGDNYPSEWIGFSDAQNFCQKLTELTGKVFMLPSEAQWEYAARGGHMMESNQTMYAGNDSLPNVAWYNTNSNGHTHPVKSKQPNILGIYDMSGNVVEWCSDRYDTYESYTQTDPHGPDIGSYRVVRGGCWNSDADECRVSARHGVQANRSRWTGEFGMRVVMLSE